jgi:hypothetical protein
VGLLNGFTPESKQKKTPPAGKQVNKPQYDTTQHHQYNRTQHNNTTHHNTKQTPQHNSIPIEYKSLLKSTGSITFPVCSGATKHNESFK